MDGDSILRSISKVVEAAREDLKQARALRATQNSAARSRAVNAVAIAQKQEVRKAHVRRLIELRAQKDLLLVTPVTIPGKEVWIRNVDELIRAIEEQLDE